ncbi:MAG: M48 family metalloprotease, partial [Acidobacteria bacterium]|nr:M48 family metalloprotease [Acidobacteriota bacterium]
MQLRNRVLIISVAAVWLAVLPALADRTNIRPGWSLFSVEQDVEMGRELDNEARSVMPIIQNSYANGYIDSLGQQLAAHAPGYRYQYQFRIINDHQINAFALLGGFIYVTSGLIEAAATEPELAGLVAHQIAHVALRHGSQQVSRAYAAAVRNARPGSVSVDAAMTRLDIAFEPDSIVLKFPAAAEREADLLGAQIMYDARFDPRQMPLFFQKLRNEQRNLSAAFFTNHPMVANRIAKVRREMQVLGGLPSNLRGNSPDLATTKRHLRDEATGSVID